jgi:uncharacterized protein YegP (UPF0339 family)
MSETETEGGRLYQTYARYVGEPDSKKDVYGYWLFMFGSILAFAGILFFLLLTATEVGQGLKDTNREVFFYLLESAYIIAATGLPLALLGIVLLLPVQRFGILLTFVGALVALGGVGWFFQVFPANWPPTESVNKAPLVIALYSSGVAVIALVTMLVPVFTGEKSLFFRSEYERSQEYPDVEVGEAIHGGMFSVYKSGEEWTWRMIEETAVSGSVEDYLSRLEAEESVERIKEKVAEASLMEIKTAAFRLYEAGEDTWQWVLMREDGSRVATSEDEYTSQNDAADAVNELKERGPTADVIEIEEGGAFNFVERGSDVHWQLVDAERQVLGEGPTGYSGRSAAENAVDGVRQVTPDARTLAVQDFGVELYKRGEAETAIEVYDDAAAAEDIDTGPSTGGPWNWRLVDSADTTLAISQDGHDARRELEERVYDILETVQTAPVLDSSQPGFEIYPKGNGWSWRLLDDRERSVGTIHGDDAVARDAAESSAQLMRQHAGDADIVSIEGAEFEYFRSSDGWQWRLVTEAREPIAVSTAAFSSKQEAADAVRDVQTMADDAELIEFENAAAQVYEHAGEWRWRFIDEDGNVMADSGEEHDSKESAMGELMTIMESASDAEVLEIETAAFELYNDEDDDWWNWRLVNLAGETVARGAEEVQTRQEARENMDRLVESGVDTNIREMQGAIFQVYADDRSEWHWRFVHVDGTIVADSTENYATRDEAATELESSIKPAAAGGDIEVIESLALQVDQRGDRYTWRIIDSDRETIAASTRSYVDRGDVTQLLAGLQELAMDSTVFELKDYTFHVTHGDEGWGWELVDDEREALMQSDEAFGSLDGARESIDHIQSIIEDAGIVDVEDAAFEIYQYEDRWRWQLIDAAENVMASGAQDYASRNAVEEAIEEIRSELDDASIIDIERAAFELTESEGKWKWRLIDETGNPVAAAITEYDSRREARDAMEVLKEYGPEALTQVAE